MNSMRRLLFTVCIVALLVATLVAPMSVSAAKADTWQVRFWVSEGAKAVVNAGPVVLVVPEGAMPRTGLVIAKVTADENTVTVDFHPKYEFNGTVYLGFEDGVKGAVQVTKGGNELIFLTEAEPPFGPEDYTYFEIDHFSRYSGWF